MGEAELPCVQRLPLERDRPQLVRTIRISDLADERVAAELNWYSQDRGYPLSYLAGNHLVWKLKRDVATSWGRGRTSTDLDRTFHDVFLRSGADALAIGPFLVPRPA